MVAASGAMAMMIPVANRDEPLLRACSRINKIMTLYEYHITSI